MTIEWRVRRDCETLAANRRVTLMYGEIPLNYPVLVRAPRQPKLI